MPRIQPAPVERDQDGYWWHPDLPDFDESVERYRAWLDEQQLETWHTRLEDEPEENPIVQSYFEKGDPDISAWAPSAPDGDGWFCLGIWDTEDGPYAWFARPRTLA